MNIHRVTTHSVPPLPPIRVHDGNMDSGSDSLSSPKSQRSQPREIPIPRHGSPTSSRGSLRGSAPSLVVPPILSLEPPKIQQQWAAPKYQTRPHGSSPAADWEDRTKDAGRPRKTVPLELREHDGSERGQSPRGWLPSPVGRLWASGSYGSPDRRDSFSPRENSLDKRWREGFYPPIAPPKDLQSEDSLRQQVQDSVKAYDTSLVRKLDAGTSSEPSSAYPRNRLTPPRELNPFGGGGAADDGRLPSLPSQWQQPIGSPRGIPAASSVPLPGPAALENPLQRWAQAATGDGRQRTGAEQPPPPLPLSLSEFRSSGDNASVSSHFTDDLPSSGDGRLARSGSASLLGPGYDDAGNRHSRGSYDSVNDDGDSQMDDTPASHVAQMRHLTLQEARTPPQSNSHPSLYNQRVGSKRRASELEGEDIIVGNSEPTRKGLLLENLGGDIYSQARRTPPIHTLRTSPGGSSKFYPSPAPRSASGSFTSASASSANTMWSTSIGQFSTGSSIATDRTSPVGSFSPSSEMENMSESPFRPLPSTLGSSRPSTRQRSYPEGPLSSSKEKNVVAPKPPSMPKMNGMNSAFICECCPKKPKKFENQHDLALHEMEKQYSCQYCNNRFKNKNEAERHQNSLHLRKHSWSCAALAGKYEAAFHQSPHHPNHADVCGYCGKEFPTPAQWSIRIDHLTTEHKFGECNQSKKFFRADHFRQHLKHSHSGTSGKWTNVLEASCQKDEPNPILHGGIAPPVISEEISE